MGFFSGFERGAKQFFTKGRAGGHQLFGKGSIVSKGLGDVSKGISKVGGVLGSVGKVAGSILNNPLVQTGLMALGPEASIGAEALTSGLQAGSGVLKQTGGLLKQRNYSGNPSQVANNILERASGIANTAGVSTSPPTMSDGQTTYAMM